MSDRGVQGRKKATFRDWLKSIQQLSPKSSLSSLHIYIYIFIDLFFQLITESVQKPHHHCAAATSLGYSKDQISSVSTTSFSSWSFFGTTSPFLAGALHYLGSHTAHQHASGVVWLPSHQHSIWRSWAHPAKKALCIPTLLCYALDVSLKIIWSKAMLAKLLPYKKYVPYGRNIHPFSRPTWAPASAIFSHP